MIIDDEVDPEIEEEMFNINPRLLVKALKENLEVDDESEFQYLVSDILNIPLFEAREIIGETIDELKEIERRGLEQFLID